jgi:amidase
VSDLLFRPATELADLVRSGEVSSRELVENSLARIDEVDAELNAWVFVDSDGALAAADEIKEGDERPFCGVPIAVKDLFAPVAGMPQTHGTGLIGHYVPDYDYGVVRRLREAGFVLMGKVNTPEFGILPVTEPRHNGATRNPWDTERTPGGSSGGSSAAVASGTVPVAHGSDGGGSIRIPAACTGLVGLKVARGRISRAPELGEHFLSTDGALTRTVGDCAAMLDVMAGYELGDSSWAPPPDEPFAEAARREPGRLRVAYTVERPIDTELDAASEQAVRDAATLLESLGHEVEEVTPPWKGVDALPIFTVLWSANVAASIRHAQMVSGTEPTADNIEPVSWHLYEQAQGFTSIDLIGATAMLQAFARRIVTELWADHDVVLVPALAKRPVRIGEIDACGQDPAREFEKSGEFAPFTPLFNLTGQPAISVPLFHGDDGLPLAVQLAGPPAGEALLLQLAAQLEQARPWADRRPEL